MTALERAFQLARSGRVAGLTDIVTSLKRDGYSASQLEGPLLKRQLAGLIKAARKGVENSGIENSGIENSGIENSGRS